ncbi:sodium-dependent bicarbonate transport family permease [Vibrio metschnikovii]
MAVLGASASYIAVPAAMKESLPGSQCRDVDHRSTRHYFSF